MQYLENSPQLAAGDNGCLEMVLDAEIQHLSIFCSGPLTRVLLFHKSLKILRAAEISYFTGRHIIDCLALIVQNDKRLAGRSAMLRVVRSALIVLFVAVFSLFDTALLLPNIALAQSIPEMIEEAESAMIADDLNHFFGIIQDIAGDEAAVSQLKESAESGNAKAGLYYSIIMIDRAGPNSAQAIRDMMPYLKRASEKNVNFSNLFLLFSLSEIEADPDEYDRYLLKALKEGGIPASISDRIRDGVTMVMRRDDYLSSADREAIEQKAREGNVRLQIFLAERYSKGGDDRFPRNVIKALDWAQKAAEINEDAFGYKAVEIESAYADELPNPAQQRIAQFIHHSEVAKIAALQLRVDACQTPACAFQEVWSYADVTGDNALTIAELARFQRNLVKFSVSEKGGMQNAEELLALHGALVLILPVGASAVMNSFDYDGDGRLSPGEIVGEGDIAVLASIGEANTEEGLDFAALGERLRAAVSALPHPF